MITTSRKKRPLDRSNAVRDAVLVVVATEGAITEGIYFSLFESTRVQVKVVPTSGGKSSPDHVYDRLKQYQRDYELGDGDELWLAIDKDRWTHRSLSTIASRCHRESIGLALSNPCFEIWLAMHFPSSETFPEIMTSKEAEALLKGRFPGYSKSKFDVHQLSVGKENAITVARSLDAGSRARWPNKTGSRMYKLVESIERKFAPGS
ncbi:RloB domain-containing protein [Asaia siamensis]